MENLTITSFELICLPQGRQVKLFKVDSNYSDSEGQDLGTRILPPHMERPDGKGRLNLQTVLTLPHTHLHPPQLYRLYFLPSMTGVQRELMFLTYFFVGVKDENTGPHMNLCSLLDIDVDPCFYLNL